MVSGLDFGLLNSSRPGPIRRGAAVKTGTRVRWATTGDDLDEVTAIDDEDEETVRMSDAMGTGRGAMNGPTTENDAGERHPVVRVVHHHGAVAGEERVGSEERRTTPAGNSTAPPPRLVISVRRPRRRPATPPLRLLDPAAPLSAAHDAGLRALSL
uniref:Uncharacterized protein n=1 Tax=Oryza sativa subsp. japonica TaxID=39947 RepID=Q6ZBE7_ORYSJ|nr:hypothetical protein [Oryza sativa Japonica Group]